MDRVAGRSQGSTLSIVLVYDRLMMLVTGDPVAELDSALGFAQQRLCLARHAGDQAAVRRLTAWIDRRLDERLAFRDSSATP